MSPKPYGVGCGKKAEVRVGRDDLILVEKSQLAVTFEDSLDDEHDVCSPRVVFVEDEGYRSL